MLGVVPKSYLPNYGEFYEARQFSAGRLRRRRPRSTCSGETVPFGAGLLFEVANLPLLRFHVEICEDVWVPIPPSSFAALAGATVLVNLSASNVVVGKSGYRHQLVGQQSARCLAAYLYTSAGRGESSTDMAWDGQALIYEKGELLAESARFSGRVAHHLRRRRPRAPVARAHAHDHVRAIGAAPCAAKWRRSASCASSSRSPRERTLPLARSVERFPYVPADRARRDERCTEVYNIQVQALVQRLSSSGIQKVVIGVSGGLDSTHALLVCAKVMDRLKLPRTNILAYTMPGFATSERTLQQARELMEAVGCTRAAKSTSARAASRCSRTWATRTPRASEEYDITFENVQAGERTSHLFRLANFHSAIVIGTGDLSELALGWCTYGVGDHMSHYNVNASVPKTLIIAPGALGGRDRRDRPQGRRRCCSTSSTPKSAPSWCRARRGDAKPAQSTESVIGPYELQDFNLYYILRYGFAPSQGGVPVVRRLARQRAGRWPDETGTRNQYDLAAIKRNLSIFLCRFFKTSQFKRSLRAERTEGRQRRLAVAARRLARTERLRGDRLARRPGDHPRLDQISGHTGAP